MQIIWADELANSKLEVIEPANWKFEVSEACIHMDFSEDWIGSLDKDFRRGKYHCYAWVVLEVVCQQ